MHSEYLYYDIITILFCGVALTGCIKNGKNRTIKTSMTIAVAKGTAKLGTFTATAVEPATITPQLNDTATALIITGYNSNTGDKIILTVPKYTETPGTFSIVNSQASALYYHGTVISPSNGGIVALKEIASNVIIGYFSFTTVDGYTLTNGEFTVGRPWNY